MGRHPDVGPTGSRSPGRSGGAPARTAGPTSGCRTPGQADAAADSQVAAYAGPRRRHCEDGASRNGERHAHPAVVAGSSQPFLRAWLAGCTLASQLEPAAVWAPVSAAQAVREGRGPAEGQLQGGSVLRVADQPDLADITALLAEQAGDSFDGEALVVLDEIFRHAGASGAASTISATAGSRAPCSSGPARTATSASCPWARPRPPKTSPP